MSGRVLGKVALITGAARGIGRSHAVRLAEEGADIIAIDLCADLPFVSYASSTEPDLATTAEMVEAAGGRVVTCHADVRDRAALKRAIDDGVRSLGRLDVVCANAGIMSMIRAWHEVTAEEWQAMIDINLTGAWNTAQLCAPHLVDGGGGSIVFMGSTASLKGLPFVSPYVVSKHGLIGLMRAFATELADHNVRVNTIVPCAVETSLETDARQRYATMLDEHPRLAAMMTNLLDVRTISPRDVSDAVVFLASDESRYITSLALTVDAGNSQY